MARPTRSSAPVGDYALLAVAVVAVSTSAPLIRGADAPTLAIAFWRNILALPVVGGWVLLRRDERTAWSERTDAERRLSRISGLLLAAHFATWVPSLRYTSVASATAIVCSQPVWVALIARATGHAVPRRAWAGIAIALVGVVLLTGVDLSLDRRALVGDLLALLGGVFAALYTVAGAEVRRTVSTTSYTTLCYSTCSVVLLAGCLAGGVDLWGYDGTTWLQLLALTLGAQLLGHTVFNVVLRTTSPTVVSLFLLLEVPGAAVIAAAWLGQVPPLAAVPAALLLLLGLGIVVSARTDDVEPAIPAE